MWRKVRRLLKWRIKGILEESYYGKIIYKKVEYVEPPKREEPYFIYLKTDIILSSKLKKKRQKLTIKDNKYYIPDSLRSNKLLKEFNMNIYIPKYLPVLEFYRKYYIIKNPYNNHLLSSKTPFRLIEGKELTLKQPFIQHTNSHKYSHFTKFNSRSDLCWPYIWYWRVNYIKDTITIWKKNKYINYINSNTNSYSNLTNKYGNIYDTSIKGVNYIYKLLNKKKSSIRELEKRVLYKEWKGRDTYRLRNSKRRKNYPDDHYYDRLRLSWIKRNHRELDSKIYYRPHNKSKRLRYNTTLTFYKGRIVEEKTKENLLSIRNYYELLKEEKRSKRPDWEKEEIIGRLFMNRPIQYWSHLMHYHKDKKVLNKIIENNIKRYRKL